MASDKKAEQAASFACRCLNVRITTSTPSTASPDYLRDANYTPVFVQDDGISVTHPQVTVRLTATGVPIPGTSRCSRFTAVTCLFCELPVYRVHQIISMDIEGNESTLMPTDEWVEHEILKSSTGWIEVHKDCIAGDSISSMESSSSYVPLFSVHLPPSLSPPASSPVLIEDDLLPKKEQPPKPDVIPASFFSDMKPVFLPPPFTSSNPIFVHLAGIANKQSQELRADADERIKDFIKAETAGIEGKEQDLRRQVELLWKNFRRHLSTLEAERSKHAENIARSPTRNDVASPNGVAASATSSSVTVRSFVPTPVANSAVATSSSITRKSALSASLATSTFHHPREHQKRSSSAEGSTDSFGSPSSGATSSRSGSSTLVHPVQQTDGINVLQFKRNINDTINTEASYRYFVNLEEDMERFKRAQEQEARKHTEVSTEQHVGPSSSKKVNEPMAQPRIPSPKAVTEEETEATPSRGREKGKRKVTFDVEPANKDENVDEETSEEDSRPMIFNLEDLENAEGADKSDGQHATLPLLEQPAARPSNPKRPRPQATNALDTFNSIRPSSLPSPSHIRPMRSQPGVDSSSQSMMLSLPRAPIVQNESPPQKVSSSSSQVPSGPQDAELLKLVAANTPSHRGAWTSDSKAWQTFTRRQDKKDSVGHGNIPEEVDTFEESVASTAPVALRKAGARKDETKDDLSSGAHNVAGSLPVSIVNRLKPKEQLSLSSYLPPSALPALPEQEASTSTSAALGINRVPSSSAVRKAAYAERDRARSLDPGPLDFTAEADEDADEDDDDLADGDDAGEKARKRAQRILQARSELPEEGMWRSLA